jgi:hypothetical protein
MWSDNEKAGPALSKTVRGWIETVGRDGKEAREGDWKKGRGGKEALGEKQTDTDRWPHDYLIFDLILN